MTTTGRTAHTGRVKPTFLVISAQEIVRSKTVGPAGPGLLEAKIKSMGPYAHDFGMPVRELNSNNWLVRFSVPEDPSWCL